MYYYVCLYCEIQSNRLVICNNHASQIIKFRRKFVFKCFSFIQITNVINTFEELIECIYIYFFVSNINYLVDTWIGFIVDFSTFNYYDLNFYDLKINLKSIIRSKFVRTHLSILWCTIRANHLSI